jgi:hypothetical protein
MGIDEESDFDSSQGQKILLSSAASISARSPRQAYYPVGPRGSFLELKCSEREAEHTSI